MKAKAFLKLGLGKVQNSNIGSSRFAPANSIEYESERDGTKGIRFLNSRLAP